MRPKFPRTSASGRPVDQLDRMDNRNLSARCDLRDATKIACCDHIRSQSLDSPDFKIAQPSCDVRLQNIVGTSRTAAQMTIGNIAHGKAKLGQQVLRLLRDALSVLQRAGGVISDNKTLRITRVA